jgi:hypothetical protein
LGAAVAPRLTQEPNARSGRKNGGSTGPRRFPEGHPEVYPSGDHSVTAGDSRQQISYAISMNTLHLIPSDISKNYEVREWRNATGVLTTAYPTEWQEVLEALRSFKLRATDILAPGKNKSDLAKNFDAVLTRFGWVEKKFDTIIKVDEQEYESPTHKVDCYKNKVALEVEWNNKDPFFDRDLNNFRLLFELRVIDVGIIVTRCSELQVLFKRLNKGTSYGNSTTHMKKLISRLEGGGGGGCPILVFGISPAMYEENLSAEQFAALGITPMTPEQLRKLTEKVQDDSDEDEDD